MKTEFVPNSGTEDKKTIRILGKTVAAIGTAQEEVAMGASSIIIICLIIALSYLLIICTMLKRDKETAEKKQKYDLQILSSRISRLENERELAQKQIEQQAKKISNLRDSLAEAERERDFYKNIQEESGKLNVSHSKEQAPNSQLDAEQSEICQEMETSTDNFFITGKAGTGKSYMLEAFKRRTGKKHIVLAPTGLAALNVGGATLHSTFGYYNLVNLDIDEISSETIRLKSEKQLVLKLVSTIIIDEISMVRADTFDKIDRILRVINESDKPFGGKQLLLFGDLFQLPPIANRPEWVYLEKRYGGVHFFFSDAFRQSGFLCRELTINHRQKEDAEYFELLNRIRDGSFLPKDISSLNKRVVRELSVYDRFTALLPTKAEAERINRERISQLNSQEYTYYAENTYCKYPNKAQSIDKIFPIVETLRLKKGVLVMMVVNDPEHRWVNGTLGIVSDLSDGSISVAINECVYQIEPFSFSEQEITYEDGKLKYEDILTVTQYPLVPAYAITIHKSQGQTYQNIICDINKCFADGQAYVALSRCSSLDGLHLVHEITKASIRVNKSVLDYYYKNFYSNKHLSTPQS